tara:strand:+ start:335 stop:715 length:381 start_codon:yes stop_codon:yes gene_type:complete
MSYFLLKALEVLAMLISLQLNVMLAGAALALLCPPLMPMASLLWILPAVVFRENFRNVLRRGDQDIQCYQQGNASFLSTAWSCVAAGFSAALCYPSVEIFNVLTGRASPSTLVPDCVSDYVSSFSM